MEQEGGPGRDDPASSSGGGDTSKQGGGGRYMGYLRALAGRPPGQLAAAVQDRLRRFDYAQVACRDTQGAVVMVEAVCIASERMARQDGRLLIFQPHLPEEPASDDDPFVMRLRAEAVELEPLPETDYLACR
jgi:hypothetical protein